MSIRRLPEQTQTFVYHYASGQKLGLFFAPTIDHVRISESFSRWHQITSATAKSNYCVGRPEVRVSAHAQGPKQPL